jgi:hypothetical protein
MTITSTIHDEKRQKNEYQKKPKGEEEKKLTAK